jgi:hypothetical protein
MGGPPTWRLGEGLASAHRKENSLLRNVTQGLGIQRGLVNTGMKLQISYKAGNFLTS